MVHRLYEDFVDDIVNLEFQQLFFAKYPESKLDFLSDPFQQCMRQVAEQRKPLIFFLHNENSEASQRYFELFAEPEVENLVCKKFLLLGWKINNANDEDFCESLTDKIFVIQETLDYVRNQNPAIFIILPNEGSVEVFRRIEIPMDSVDNFQDTNCTSAKLLSFLKEVEKKCLLSFEDFKDMTSMKYQQWMYEELGDRDYDSFEPDEGELLKNKILYAMYGPPKELKNSEFGYEPKQIEETEKIYTQIRVKNNEYSKWNDRIVIAFIYNCIEPLASEKEGKAKKDPNYKPENDFCPTPIFVLRKCKSKLKCNKDENRNDNKLKTDEIEKHKHGCRIFIDSNCRVYTSWEKYLTKNTLPRCKMIYPKLGRYQSYAGHSEVLLGEQFSPSCSLREKILQACDIGSGIAGFASGTALIASMFTPAAVFTIPAAVATGIAAGAYGSTRSAYTLVDRGQHEQSINITNSESRAAYFNIAAGAVGVVGAGATKLLSTAVQRGVNVAEGFQHTVTAINGANIIISGSATANSCYDVYQQYTDDGVTPSALTIAQLGSSLFFFGNSVYNFRTGTAMVRELQTNTLNEISEGLRSNRHRKTFNKMLKETVRVKGDVKGKAEVISSMRNSASRDNVLAVLTRSNKKFNKMGIRFSAEGGGISLNGVPHDILEFGNLPKTQQGVRLQNLPPIPENNPTYTRTIIGNLHYDTAVNNVCGASRLDVTTVITTLMPFAQDLHKKILEICENFTNQMDVGLIIELRNFFEGDVRTKIIQYITDFIRIMADNLKTQFERSLLHENVEVVCKDFGFKNPHVTIDTFITYVINQFLVGDMMQKLKENFTVWYASLTYDQEQKEERKKGRRKHVPKVKQDCSECGGYFYKNQTS